MKNPELFVLVLIASIIGLAGYIMLLAVLGMVFVAFVIVSVLVAANTIVALFAWKHPVTIGSDTLIPEHARGLIIGGLFGAVVVLAVAFLMSAALKVEIPFEGWYYYAGWFGYVCGVIGFFNSLPDDPAPLVTIDQLPSAPPAPLQIPQQHRFDFASWDDEELRR